MASGGGGDKGQQPNNKHSCMLNKYCIKLSLAFFLSCVCMGGFLVVVVGEMHASFPITKSCDLKTYSLMDILNTSNHDIHSSPNSLTWSPHQSSMMTTTVSTTLPSSTQLQTQGTEFVQEQTLSQHDYLEVTTYQREKDGTT